MGVAGLASQPGCLGKDSCNWNLLVHSAVIAPSDAVFSGIDGPTEINVGDNLIVTGYVSNIGGSIYNNGIVNLIVPEGTLGFAIVGPIAPADGQAFTISVPASDPVYQAAFPANQGDYNKTLTLEVIP